MVTTVARDAPVFAGMNSSTWPRPVPPAGESCTALVLADTARPRRRTPGGGGVDVNQVDGRVGRQQRARKEELEARAWRRRRWPAVERAIVTVNVQADDAGDGVGLVDCRRRPRPPEQGANENPDRLLQGASSRIAQPPRLRNANIRRYGPVWLPALRARQRSRPRSSRVKAVVIGVLFGLLFGASTVYLGLRAGLTVSASIPIAVLAISVLKKLGGSTILENNIVQTIGSAGESVAGGVVFTIPALIFLTPDGPAYFNYFQIPMLAFAGGILGVLMMVPLRRALIVKEHGVLPYPEGAACADVLIAGERGGKLASMVFGGLGVGALWKALSWVFNLFLQELGYSTPRTSQFPNATLNVDISPEYMGVGYVIGPRIAGTMFAGGVLSWLVLLPLLSILGAYITVPFPPIHPNFAQQPGDRPAVPDLGDEPGTAVERLHPLHRRRRGARGRPDHARPHAADDRRVGPREPEGLRRRRAARPRRCAPSATCRLIVRARRLVAARDLPRGRAEDADAGQLPRRDPGHRLRLPLRHRVVAHHRPHRHLVEPDLGDDDRHADPHLPDVRRARLDRRRVRPDRALRRRRRLHRGREGRRHVSGSEDRLPRRRDAALPADRPDHRRGHLGRRHRLDDALPAPGVRDRLARRCRRRRRR